MSRVMLYKFTIIISVLSMSFILPMVSLAATYYASPAGSGSTCSSSTPCSLSTGLGKLSAGDTLYLQSGTYSGQQIYFSTSGTSTNPITISGVSGQSAILDGKNWTVPSQSSGGGLVDIRGNYVTIQNLTIQYSGYIGLRLDGTNDTANNVFVQHSWQNGIVGFSNHDTIENCQAYYNSELNDHAAGRSMSGGWATGISCARYPQYCTIKNCTAWNNWGEGISTFEAWNTTMQDNVSYDNWSDNMYISDTKDTVAQRNLLYSTSGDMMTQYQGGKYNLMIDDEVGCPLSLTNPNGGRENSHDNTVINNLLIGSPVNLALDTKYTNNDLIAYNDFVNSASTNILFWVDSKPTNSRFENNIIEQDSSSGSIFSGSGSGLSFSHNLWSQTPSGAPTDSNIVTGNPLLTKTGTVSAGKLTGDYFKLQAGSPAIGKALPLTAVTGDYFENNRGSTPDIGAVQYQSSQTTLTAPSNLRLIQ